MWTKEEIEKIVEKETEGQTFPDEISKVYFAGQLRYNLTMMNLDLTTNNGTYY